MIHAFLTDGPTELADQVYDAVRATIEHERQRAFIGPWRIPDMNKLVPIGLGVAAVVVAIVLGTQFLGRPAPGGVGGAPSAAPSATAEPSVAAPSPTPSPTPTPPPPLTETFTSERHGISFSYPSGWVTRPATEPWTTSVPDFISTDGDIVHDPIREGNLWIVVASQPIGDSTPEEWVGETITFDDECAATEPIAVDGAAGLIGVDRCRRAAVTTDGRGYVIWLYTTTDDPSLAVTYDRAYFEEVLATVKLQPEDAVDVAPSASP
jgi:hypothetical protein